ncbi:MAG TPA: ChbG/HpnK family deacetylase [Methylophilaceae bacterium]|nr:ChbG/HpnK family deacetylase [Methylophilaceae bacterium]
MSADDYALNEEVDAAILDLIRHGLLTAASCLVLSPRWPEAAKQLKADILARADIGLHLDFTEFGQPVRHSLPMLIARAKARLLSQNAVNQSIEVQLDRFEKALGRTPDYVDGHQHVHQLPQIRDALVNILHRRYGDNGPWIRLADPAGNTLKEKIIRRLGARKLGIRARQAGLSCSARLLGVYDFDLNEQAYQASLTHWLEQAVELAPETCALMCHPAIAAPSKSDPIAEARRREYEVLKAGLGALLDRYGLTLARGNVLGASGRTAHA